MEATTPPSYRAVPRGAGTLEIGPFTTAGAVRDDGVRKRMATPSRVANVAQPGLNASIAMRVPPQLSWTAVAQRSGGRSTSPRDGAAYQTMRTPDGMTSVISSDAGSGDVPDHVEFVK